MYTGCAKAQRTKTQKPKSKTLRRMFVWFSLKRWFFGFIVFIFLVLKCQNKNTLCFLSCLKVYLEYCQKPKRNTRFVYILIANHQKQKTCVFLFLIVFFNHKPSKKKKQKNNECVFGFGVGFQTIKYKNTMKTKKETSVEAEPNILLKVFCFVIARSFYWSYFMCFRFVTLNCKVPCVWLDV